MYVLDLTELTIHHGLYYPKHILARIRALSVLCPCSIVQLYVRILYRELTYNLDNKFNPF